MTSPAYLFTLYMRNEQLSLSMKQFHLNISLLLFIYIYANAYFQMVKLWSIIYVIWGVYYYYHCWKYNDSFYGWIMLWLLIVIHWQYQKETLNLVNFVSEWYKIYIKKNFLYCFLASYSIWLWLFIITFLLFHFSFFLFSLLQIVTIKLIMVVNILLAGFHLAKFLFFWFFGHLSSI